MWKVAPDFFFGLVYSILKINFAPARFSWSYAIMHRPPPPPIKLRGTYVRFPSPNPHIPGGGGIFPYLGYWLPLAIITKTSPVLGFLGKSSWDYAPKYPLSAENGNTHVASLYAFECVCVCGGGGGGDT